MTLHRRKGRQDDDGGGASSAAGGGSAGASSGGNACGPSSGGCASSEASFESIGSSYPSLGSGLPRGHAAPPSPHTRSAEDLRLGPPAFAGGGHPRGTSPAIVTTSAMEGNKGSGGNGSSGSSATSTTTARRGLSYAKTAESTTPSPRRAPSPLAVDDGGAAVAGFVLTSPPPLSRGGKEGGGAQRRSVLNVPGDTGGGGGGGGGGDSVDARDLRTPDPIPLSKITGRNTGGRNFSSRGDDGGGKRGPLLGTLLRYVADEVRPGGRDVFAEEDTRPELYTFLRVPGEVEKILSLGFFLVADCFLYMFTFLPVRVACALWEVLSRPVATLGRRGISSGARIDLARAFIIVVVSAVLMTVDTSTVYHYVRVQSAIKLYALFNLLEIGDKLFGSFGMDVFYSLHRTLQWSRGPFHRRWPLPLLIAVIYTLGHTMVLFAQVIALNVAVNSESNVLLTLLISNQFVELKSSVFKKFTKLNLFQITCHDMGERFQLFIFASSVTLPMLNAIDWSSWETAREPLADVGYVVAIIGASELVIDYVKHAFITKFNFISPDEYTHFRRIILNDLVECRRTHAYVDYSMVISRRIGFSTAPLACLAVRLVAQHIKSGNGWSWATWAVWWFNLVLVKVILGTVLLVIAHRSSAKWDALQREKKKEVTTAMAAWQGRA